MGMETERRERNGCPTREQLGAFDAGKLPEDVQEAVATHVEDCDLCLAVLAALGDPSDSVLTGLRTPVPPEVFLAEDAGRVSREAPARDQNLLLTHDSSNETDGSVPLGQLGDYRLVRKLGSGAMGDVYLAIHTRLEKRVAVKVMAKGLVGDPKTTARFAREMKAVGRLEHRNVVQALDAREEGGAYLLVMEYVEGCTLARLLNLKGPLSVADACEVIRQAAVGLQHAHAQGGVIHRDLKPSNLMVTPDGCVKILDLGLARIRGEWLGDAQSGPITLTSASAVLGTADYMAPEQWDDSHTADIRADIYSLGCTLYHLLTGTPPFAGPGYDTYAKKMKAHTFAPIPPLQEGRRDVPDRLDWVLRRMLAKEPGARFATPVEVAAAVKPFAEGCDLPKLLAAAGVASSSIRTPSEVNSRHESGQQAASDASQPAAGAGIPTAEARRRLPAPRWWRRLTFRVSIAAGALVLVGAALLYPPTRTWISALGSGPRRTKVLDPPAADGEKGPQAEVSGPRWIELRRIQAHRGPVRAVAFSHDGQQLASGGEDGRLYMWNPATGTLARPWKGHEYVIRSVAYSSDGKHIAYGGSARHSSSPGGIVVLDVATGKEIFSSKVGVSRVAFSPDGKNLACACAFYDRVAKVWNLQNGQEILSTQANAGAIITDVAFSRDGKFLATNGDGGAVNVWCATTGNLVRSVAKHTSMVTGVTFSLDSRYLFSSGAPTVYTPSEPGEVKAWDVTTGQDVWTLATRKGTRPKIVLSPSGKYLASGSSVYDGPHRPCLHNRVYVWNAQTGSEILSLGDHKDEIFAVAFGPSDRWLASASGDGIVMLWELPLP